MTVTQESNYNSLYSSGFVDADLPWAVTQGCGTISHQSIPQRWLNIVYCAQYVCVYSSGGTPCTVLSGQCISIMFFLPVLNILGSWRYNMYLGPTSRGMRCVPAFLE